MAHTESRRHPHVQAVIDETGEPDPFDAVRAKARQLVTDYTAALGETPPFNVEALASYRGLRASTDAPRFSLDSELAPEADGRVVLRVNRDRPLTRQRFSVGHEVGHTLFPDYHLAVRCRKGNDRDWADPSDLLETLCDVAASEFLFPSPWFTELAGGLMLGADALAAVATDYQASREATVRRIVEVRPDPLAAVFLSWKLKPTEQRQVKRNRQHLALAGFEALSGPEPKLRVDYAILNDAFAQRCGSHIPKDKSVPGEGPIHEASVEQELRDGEQQLDLGSLHGRFAIAALPIYTADAAARPEGALSVVAVLRPLKSGI